LAFNLPAMMTNEFDDLVQNYEELSFILSSDYPNLVLELSIEQEKYEQAIKSITARSEFLLKEFQPILENRGLNKKEFPKDEFKKLLGERVFETCFNYSKDMKMHVISTCDSLPNTLRKVREYGLKEFPGEKFLNYSLV
ncbi:MAG: hypothetical protein MI867_25500, partial [Pseudomonadales bacterium]|nr:hypothetical protein [Pseudomonadales bacterium]